MLCFSLSQWSNLPVSRVEPKLCLVAPACSDVPSTQAGELHIPVQQRPLPMKGTKPCCLAMVHSCARAPQLQCSGSQTKSRSVHHSQVSLHNSTKCNLVKQLDGVTC
jgi:hypothetical protein